MQLGMINFSNDISLKIYSDESNSIVKKWKLFGKDDTTLNVYNINYSPGKNRNSNNNNNDDNVIENSEIMEPISNKNKIVFEYIDKLVEIKEDEMGIAYEIFMDLSFDIKKKVKEIKNDPDKLEKLLDYYLQILTQLNSIQMTKILKYPKLTDYKFQHTNIVFLGKSGSGKSSLINFLIGENKFSNKNIFDSQTNHCDFHDIYHKDYKRILRFIDTIGLMDTILHNKMVSLNQEYVKRMEQINYFVIIIQKGRLFGQEKQGLVEFLNGIPGLKKENILICITHCEEYEKVDVFDNARRNSFLKEYLTDYSENLFNFDYIDPTLAQNYFNNNKLIDSRKEEYFIIKRKIENAIKNRYLIMAHLLKVIEPVKVFWNKNNVLTIARHMKNMFEKDDLL